MATKGQRPRPEIVPPRKSPTASEVGPGEDFSEEEEENEENEINSEDEEDQGNSQGGEPVIGAPLGSCNQPDWSQWYAQCERWGELWDNLQNYQEDDEWPENTQIVEGRMFQNSKLCIPTPLQKEWVRLTHQFLGHVGVERMWKILEVRYEWGDEEDAKEFAKWVTRECDTCQACQRPRNKLGPIVSAPIPPILMANVAIDVFQMPSVKMEGKTYDCMVVCVDRHSGWMVVVPELTQGLTGTKVAKAMLKEWQPFGVPARITSDQGPHFANSWWKTMCGGLGISHIYTQPYHHQANGRAEVAGQQIMEILRKFHTDQRVNWVEALPRVLMKIHDTPGESGLTPYEIVFGRERFCANVPYEPPRSCEDAQDFLGV